MGWEPMSADFLQQIINEDCARMDISQKRLWECVRIVPEKWQCPPWGDEGGGFWVVGLIGKEVLWYNDIEEGFDCSSWLSYGTIDEYRCNQYELGHIIYNILSRINTGVGTLLSNLGPPQPVEF